MGKRLGRKGSGRGDSQLIVLGRKGSGRGRQSIDKVMEGHRSVSKLWRYAFTGAMCCVKLKRLEEAIDWCDEGLSVSKLTTPLSMCSPMAIWTGVCSSMWSPQTHGA